MTSSSGRWGGLGKVFWGHCPASSRAPSPQPRHRWARTELSTRRKTQAALRSQSHGGPTQHLPAESQQRAETPDLGARLSQKGAGAQLNVRAAGRGARGPRGPQGLLASNLRTFRLSPSPQAAGDSPSVECLPAQAWAWLPSEARLPSTASLAPCLVPWCGPHDPPRPVSRAARGGLLLWRQRDKHQPSTKGPGQMVQASPGPGLWSSAGRGLGTPARASEPGTAPTRLGEEDRVTPSKWHPVTVTRVPGFAAPH